MGGDGLVSEAALLYGQAHGDVSSKMINYVSCSSLCRWKNLFGDFMFCLYEDISVAGCECCIMVHDLALVGTAKCF